MIVVDAVVVVLIVRAFIVVGYVGNDLVQLIVGGRPVMVSLCECIVALGFMRKANTFAGGASS